MRKVIYGGACSLHGFVTGPGGALDWLHFSRDVQAMPAFLDAGSRIGLELIECRTLDGGCILATWRVPPAASPGRTASSAPKTTAGRGRRGSR